MKTCNKCNEVKNESEFRLKKDHGKYRLFYMCKACESKRKVISQRINNDSYRKRLKQWRDQNKEHCREKEKKRRDENIEHCRDYHKTWRTENKKKVKLTRDKANYKRRNQPDYNISDEYIKGIISGRNKIPFNLIPIELIESYRMQIKCKRLLKQIKNGSNNESENAWKSEESLQRVF